MSKKVLISSMPWPNYNMPSIQLAVLKAYLEQHQIECEAAHWYLEIADYFGFQYYNEISSNNAEGGEAIYAYLYFESDRDNLVKKNTFISNILFKNPRFFDELELFHQSILDRYDWQDYSLVGFTLNFSQTIASLYMANEIKKRNSKCKIIIGGAEATDKLGASLIENFNCLDFACNGEGESVLLNLSKELLKNKEQQNFEQIGGLIYRNSLNNTIIKEPDQLTSLESLPQPIFTEYFEYLESHDNLTLHDLSVVIPIESSRGCYYNCSFCSLNIQWIKTRNQVPERVSMMMKYFSEKYKILDFFFVDNITPTNSKEIFERVKADNRDYRFFYEMRANIPLENLHSMHNAGLTRVQIGIESMSSSLLNKFNKKLKTINNIQGLKNCEELGIIISSNFIINHPCTDQNDIQETLDNIEFCFHLRPPNAFSEFGLIYGSPDFNSPRSEFEVLGNHKMYNSIYPMSMALNLNLPLKEFRNKGQDVDWNVVKNKVELWEKAYLNSNYPLLFMQDGITFLKIEDRRFGRLDVYILEGYERKIYLYIHQIKPLSKILSNFPEIENEKIINSLAELKDLKLLFEEEDKFLALALKKKCV